jgi:hypothetical protein
MSQTINPDNGSLNILGSIDTLSGISTKLNITNTANVDINAPVLGEAALSVTGGAYVGGDLYVEGSIVSYGDVITLGQTGSTIIFSADISSALIPSEDITYDLGSETRRWRDLYLDGSTIHLGDMTISKDATTGNLKMNGEEIAPRSEIDEVRQAHNTTKGEFDSYKSGGPARSLSRTIFTHTTSTLGVDATENATITGASTYALMSIEVSDASWVRVYSSAAAMTADASRPDTQDPENGSGVLSEVITTGLDTIKFTPASVCWNDDASTNSNVYIAITNKSNTSSSIQITMNVLVMEI